MTLRKFFGGDFTAVEHAVYGLLMQVVAIGICKLLNFTDYITLGTLVPILWFWGREHAQAEALLKKETHRIRPEIRALAFWKWKYASQMDWYCPLVTSVAVWCILRFI